MLLHSIEADSDCSASEGVAAVATETTGSSSDPTEPDAARVLVVDDHVLLVEGVSAALRHLGLVVESVSRPDAAEIVAIAQRLRPDVVLLDLDLGPGLECAVSLVAPLKSHARHVVMMTGTTDRTLLGECLDAGADGLIRKTETIDELVDLVMRSIHDEPTLPEPDRELLLATFHDARLAQRARLAPFLRLTARERVVLGLLMDGMQADEIARHSYVALATVRSQIRSILTKLGVSSQLSAVAMARRAGWVPGDGRRHR